MNNVTTFLEFNCSVWMKDDTNMKAPKSLLKSFCETIIRILCFVFKYQIDIVV